MAHYHIETNDDGRVRRILRDGEPHGQAVKLEQLFSIVTLYFQVSDSNLQLIEQEESAPLRRAYGVQSFLMGLTGVEAFTNTLFKLRGDELGDDEMVARVGQRHGSVTRKIEDLLARTPEGGIEDQALIIERLHELSLLRNTLVHPQWEPASVALAGDTNIIITGLVGNFQAAFEDPAFCREALMWCLLFVARVGKARGNADTSAFLFHWTGNYGLTEAQIMSGLGLT